MLAERQRYIERASVLKTERSHVRDVVRVEDVITKVKLAAKAAGLSDLIAEPVWRTLMERSIALELNLFDEKHRREAAD